MMNVTSTQSKPHSVKFEEILYHVKSEFRRNELLLLRARFHKSLNISSIAIFFIDLMYWMYMEESSQHCPNNHFCFLFLFSCRYLNRRQGFMNGELLKILLKKF